jgi:hypothetical protein
VEESEKSKFRCALLWFSAQPVSHALLVGVGIQVTTFVFLPTTAPADIVAAQAFLLVGLFLIIEESLEDFHLHLHSILLESPHPDRLSAIRIPNSALELIPAASAAPSASKTSPAAPSAFGIPLGTGFIDRDGISQKLPAVEPLDGLFCRFLGLHFHEPKSPGKPGKFILVLDLSFPEGRSEKAGKSRGVTGW